MELTVRVPGSWGELAQGLCGGRPCLLTCPIPRYVTVMAKPGRGRLYGVGPKGLQAKVRALAEMGVTNFLYDLTLSSDLVPGKGMSSSSADIAAITVAVQILCGALPSPSFISAIATAIEPTDPVYHQGLVAIDYYSGTLLRQYRAIPPLQLVCFDEGGTVDTLTFHEQGRASTFSYILPQSPLTAWALGDLATASAFANQSVLPKAHLEALWNAAKSMGAVGVCVAHSGTILAALFEGPHKEVRQSGQILAKLLPDLTYCGVFPLIGGGWQIKEQ